MRPVIKWPGGKTRELEIIRHHLPKFERYFEPFFGGGAVGFDLEPAVAYVNDIDQKLVSFYISVQSQDDAFYHELSNIISDWHKIEDFPVLIFDEYIQLFPREVANLEMMDLEAAKEFIRSRINRHRSTFSGLKRVDVKTFGDYLIKSLISKTRRVWKLQIKHSTIFDRTLMMDHVVTAVKAAYYTYLRNEIFNVKSTPAVFYFIREFCYGSMFRFNQKGEFNIPYGGINYNDKNISSKVEYLKSTEVTTVLKKFNFSNSDFISFLSPFDLTDKDFIFLDPPYDSDFKNYGRNPFGSQDQIRLADYLAKCPSKWLLVIQKSDLIWELYSEMSQNISEVEILAYDKKYTYNVRGRNHRDVSHLLIKNY